MEGKMLVKDALKKVIYKATIQTYQQNQLTGSKGICMAEGYSSDLSRGIFADLEVEHIGYDNYRKRPSIMVSKEEFMTLLETKSLLDIVNYLYYYKGYRFKGYNGYVPEGSSKEQVEKELKKYTKSIRETYINTINYYGYDDNI